jgi:hypothetical protein
MIVPALTLASLFRLPSTAMKPPTLSADAPDVPDGVRKMVVEE